MKQNVKFHRDVVVKKALVREVSFDYVCGAAMEIVDDEVRKKEA